MSVYDLLICVRCHAFPTLILDTINSFEWSCNQKHVKVVVAVDCAPKISNALKKHLGQDRVYASTVRWGWGAGLYGLLVESIESFSKRFKFSHFLSIDYDTLAIRKGFDHALLSRITSDRVGMAGVHSFDNLVWYTRFMKEKSKIEKIFGRVPDSFTPGEGVQGGCMLITQSGIEALRSKGMFNSPFSCAKKFTSIADDHLLPMFIRMCRLDIQCVRGIMYGRWKMDRDPRGLESEYFAFHPTKLKPGKTNEEVERQVRNYFRRQRKQAPL